MSDETQDQGTESRPVLDLTYERAYAEIESILAELDADRLDVDQVADRVERVALLVAHCRAKVESARFRLKVITQES